MCSHRHDPAHACTEHNDPQWQAAYVASCLYQGYVIEDDDAAIGEALRLRLPRELARRHLCLVRVPGGFKVEDLLATMLDSRRPRPWFPHRHPDDAEAVAS